MLLPAHRYARLVRKTESSMLLAPESRTRGPPISGLIKYFPPERPRWCREHYKSRKGHLLIGKWKQSRWIGSAGWARQIKINKEGDVNSAPSSPGLKSMLLVCRTHMWVMLMRYSEGVFEGEMLVMLPCYNPPCTFGIFFIRIAPTSYTPMLHITR